MTVSIVVMRKEVINGIDEYLEENNRTDIGVSSYYVVEPCSSLRVELRDLNGMVVTRYIGMSELLDNELHLESLGGYVAKCLTDALDQRAKEKQT